MPISVRRIRGKFRIVETNTGNIAKNSAGTPIDGGGHTSEAKANTQVKAVNISKAKRS